MNIRQVLTRQNDANKEHHSVHQHSDNDNKSASFW